MYIWSPSSTSFNGWGKDENWKGWVDKNDNNVIDKTNDPATNELVEGYVPMEGADVIIPKLDNALLYPYIVPEHEHSHYPMTVNFEPHRCQNIYFAPSAKIHNQHLLEYDSAFVDMAITQGGWRMVSAPLKSMYSGDMYIPHKGAHYADASASSLESSDPFYVAPFSGSRSANAPFAFWASFYNKEVSTYYDDGTNVPIVSKEAEFVQSNSMREKLLPGSGFMLWGAGPDNYTSDTLTVRLPKSESVYYSTAGNRHDVPRNGEGHKLAFRADHTKDTMQIKLSNKIESQYFLFGNPTMAYINMHDFLEANKETLDHVFYRIENEKWDASVEHTMGDDRFLAPMTSVMLVANSEAKEITVTLNAAHLTLNNQVSPFSEDNPAVTPLPKRAPVSAAESELMTIYALTDDAIARIVLATTPAANDYYLKGEDAIFLSTGVENSSSVTTPLNMYTVADQVPMMADVRQGISEIPLSVLVDDDYRTDYMQLAFYYTPNWSRTCYLVDSYTEERTRIMNGLIISVEMPLNHEQRYYIEGPDEYTSSSNGGVTTSTSGVTQPESVHRVWAYAQDGTVIINASDLIKSAMLYDITGRLITSSPNSPIASSSDSLISTERDLIFCSADTGTYMLRLNIIDKQNPVTHSFKVVIWEEQVAYSPYILSYCIKQHTDKTIWCYTGYSFENLLQHPTRRQLLELCDVLVDGRYMEAERDLSLHFRGSRNQRVIDVQKSLQGDLYLLY